MTVEYPNGECPSCGSTGRDHAPSCKLPRQDTRKTSVEKLEKMRELANEMIRVGAREPKDEAMQKLVRFGEQAHRILDGDWT